MGEKPQLKELIYLIKPKLKYHILKLESVLKIKLMALNAYIRKEESSKINSVSLYLRKLQK